MPYDKVCWSCGKDTMVNKGNYFECSECGATWNEVPAPTVDSLVIEPVYKGRRNKKYRPSQKRSRVR